MWSRSASSASKSCGRRRRRLVAVHQARFHEVRELAQAHRAGHARAALERVQRAAQLARERCRRRARAARRAAASPACGKSSAASSRKIGSTCVVDVVANAGERVVLARAAARPRSPRARRVGAAPARSAPTAERGDRGSTGTTAPALGAAIGAALRRHRLRRGAPASTARGFGVERLAGARRARSSSSSRCDRVGFLDVARA